MRKQREDPPDRERERERERERPLYAAVASSLNVACCWEGGGWGGGWGRSKVKGSGGWET